MREDRLRRRWVEKNSERKSEMTKAKADIAPRLIRASRDLSRALGLLPFGRPVTHVYNPLSYARDPWERYLNLYGNGVGKTVFMGMNPGPWGMIQTGIPFGEVDIVSRWLEISGKVGRPAHPHPRRPVEGFSCSRHEVSGRRLWGLFRSRFGTPGIFFSRHLVINYCPLGFFDNRGNNLTPDKLPSRDREPLLALCDHHLARVLAVLRPRFAVGVGNFAAGRLQSVLNENSRGSRRSAGLERMTVVRILHPSPASPAANSGWEEKVTRQLVEQGVWR
jgi:single-strand selective monofunctional uracil DNA glycosylase